MNNIDFALQHLQFVLSSITVRQSMLAADMNDAAASGRFADAASCQSMHTGLVMAETMLRDQIRGLKMAQAAA